MPVPGGHDVDDVGFRDDALHGPQAPSGNIKAPPDTRTGDDFDPFQLIPVFLREAHIGSQYAAVDSGGGDVAAQLKILFGLASTGDRVE